MRKLDPGLRRLLEQRQERAGFRQDETGTLAGLGPTHGQMVYLAVQFRGDVEDLRRVGFEPLSVKTHPTAGYSIAAGRMPLSLMESLEDIPHVMKTEGSRALYPELNHSIPEIRADILHRGVYRGAGVIVGVIDSGFDYRHHTFRKPDGTSRILGLWNQTMHEFTTETVNDVNVASPGIRIGNRPLPVGGAATGLIIRLAAQADTTQNGFWRWFGPTTPMKRLPGKTVLGVGAEYTKDDIDKALADDDLLPDVVGKHGTHVASIAAGNGSQSGYCRPAGTFVGVAPEADLILVKMAPTEVIGESLSVIHAFDFIWDHPSAAGRPIVINLSAGDNIGPHDGTSLLERAIDLDLRSSAGRAVVKSAGNEGAAEHHAEGTIRSGATVDLKFIIQPEDWRDRVLELWYQGWGFLQAQVILPVIMPGLPAPMSPPVDAGDPPWEDVVNPGAPPREQVSVRIDSDVNDPNNGDNRINVQLRPTGGGNLPVREWTLRLTNAGADATFDCWIERERGPSDAPPKFKAAPGYSITRNKTITIPGTAEHVITVGAYSQGGFLFFNWTGDLHKMSSFGPTRKGTTRPQRMKPDISAPGVGISSALSGATRGNCCCDCCVLFYSVGGEEDTGTSLAAPHVAGVVALMFQKDPTLSAQAVKQRLMSGARLPAGVTEPTNEWGAGKLDAFAAVFPPPTPRIDDDNGGNGGGRGGVGGREGTGEGSFSAAQRRDPGPALAARRRPVTAVHPAFVELHRRVLLAPGGEVYAALVSKHFSEVRGLINAKARVAAGWRGMRGPDLLRFLADAITAPQTLGVSDADVPSLVKRAERFLATLERYGSSGLIQDIRCYGPEILRLGASKLSELGAQSPPAA